MPDDVPQKTRFIARQKWLELHAGFNDEPYVVTRPGVTIVPMNYAGEIVFIREPTIHGGLADMILTLPGGVIDAGETPRQAANRELQEETGFKAEVLFPLGMVAPLPRHARWDIHLFLARNLVPARKMGDEIYQIETERVPFDDIETLITEGRLNDALVIAALYMARGVLTGALRIDPGAESGGDDG